MMTSYEIKLEIMKANLKQYEVAERLGLSETVFSKRLRKGLTENDIKKILLVISQLKGSVKNGKD